MSSQPAAWLTLAVGLITLLFGAYNARFGPLLTRKTDIDKMYLERLKIEEQHKKDLEAHCDELRDKLDEQRTQCDRETDDLRKEIYRLQQENLVLIGTRERLTLAEEKIAAMHRLLKMYMPDSDNDVID